MQEGTSSEDGEEEKFKEDQEAQGLIFSTPPPNSSMTASQSDTPHEGKYAKSCNKTTKKCKVAKWKKVKITTLMRKTIEGHFNTFKPMEVILKLAE